MDQGKEQTSKLSRVTCPTLIIPFSIIIQSVDLNIEIYVKNLRLISQTNICIHRLISYIYITKNKTPPENETRMERKIERKREPHLGPCSCLSPEGWGREKEKGRVLWCASRDHPSAINGLITSTVVREGIAGETRE